MDKAKKVIVTGGAGYVGAVLVPKLLKQGYQLKVIDLYIYGENILDCVKEDPNLIQVKGDIRDKKLLEKEIKGYDAIIHLACISNDPSFELDPKLGKSINYDAVLDLVDIAKKAKVKRFIYASSSSVYGIKEEKEVTEELSLEPLTDYSKYKAECEKIILAAASRDFVVTIIRPATVCGYSPRTRLDLTVNILTNHAVNKGEITIFGGEQMRPNLHIEDMTDVYIYLLGLPEKKIQKKVYNVGYENYKVKEIAQIVKEAIGRDIPIHSTDSNDNRSYHISSEKIKKEIGFFPKHTIEEAVRDLKRALEDGRLPDALSDIRYYNIKTMQALRLK